MNNFSDKQTAWNTQAQTATDPGAQVARPGNSEDLDGLVTDIKVKLKLGTGKISILDVGCGNGLVLSKLVDDYSDVVGVDYAQAMVESAKNMLPDGTFQTGEAGALELADNTFERVLCYSIFHYFPDDDYALKALSELVRVCKPGGIVLVGDLLDHAFEHDTKSGSNPEHAAKLPVIHRYAEWRFYDLERLADYVSSMAKSVEILEQPHSFRLHQYRKDLRICL